MSENIEVAATNTIGSVGKIENVVEQVAENVTSHDIPADVEVHSHNEACAHEKTNGHAVEHPVESADIVAEEVASEEKHEEVPEANVEEVNKTPAKAKTPSKKSTAKKEKTTTAKKTPVKEADKTTTAKKAKKADTNGTNGTNGTNVKEPRGRSKSAAPKKEVVTSSRSKDRKVTNEEYEKYANFLNKKTTRPKKEKVAKTDNNIESIITEVNPVATGTETTTN